MGVEGVEGGGRGWRGVGGGGGAGVSPARAAHLSPRPLDGVLVPLRALLQLSDLRLLAPPRRLLDPPRRLLLRLRRRGSALLQERRPEGRRRVVRRTCRRRPCRRGGGGRAALLLGRSGSARRALQRGAQPGELLARCELLPPQTRHRRLVLSPRLDGMGAAWGRHGGGEHGRVAMGAGGTVGREEASPGVPAGAQPRAAASPPRDAPPPGQAPRAAPPPARAPPRWRGAAAPAKGQGQG